MFGGALRGVGSGIQDPVECERSDTRGVLVGVAQTEECAVGEAEETDRFFARCDPDRLHVVNHLGGAGESQNVTIVLRTAGNGELSSLFDEGGDLGRRIRIGVDGIEAVVGLRIGVAPDLAGAADTAWVPANHVEAVEEGTG